jgi:hypothetical protein
MLHNEELRQPYKTLNTVRVLKWRGGGEENAYRILVRKSPGKLSPGWRKWWEGNITIDSGRFSISSFEPSLTTARGIYITCKRLEPKIRDQSKQILYGRYNCGYCYPIQIPKQRTGERRKYSDILEDAH